MDRIIDTTFDYWYKLYEKKREEERVKKVLHDYFFKVVHV